MTYKIDFLTDDDTPLYGYMMAVSPYWARLQFENEYPFEITNIEEYSGDLGEEDIIL